MHKMWRQPVTHSARLPLVRLQAHTRDDFELLGNYVEGGEMLRWFAL